MLTPPLFAPLLSLHAQLSPLIDHSLLCMIAPTEFPPLFAPTEFAPPQFAPLHTQLLPLIAHSLLSMIAPIEFPPRFTMTKFTATPVRAFVTIARLVSATNCP